MEEPAFPLGGVGFSLGLCRTASNPFLTSIIERKSFSGKQIAQPADGQERARNRPLLRTTAGFWQFQKRLTGSLTLRRQCLYPILGTAVALASELITTSPSASSFPACRSNRTRRDIAPSSLFANRFCLNFQNLLLSVNSSRNTTYECWNSPRRQRTGFRGRHW